MAKDIIARAIALSRSGGGGGGGGREVVSIKFLSSDKGQTSGLPGATDTYKILYSDGTYDTFRIYNGKNGETPLLREHNGTIEVSYDNGVTWIELYPLPDITVLFDTTENWNKQTALVSDNNAFYVYTDHIVDGDNVLPGFKLGDGNAYLIDLPFIDELYYKHIMDSVIHVTPQDRTNWNNKISCKLSDDNAENLVFFK